MTHTITFPEHNLADGVVRLRAWSADDAEPIRAAVQDPEIPRYMGIPPNHTLEGVQRWLSTVEPDLESGAGVNLAIVDADDGRLLGSVSVTRSCDDPEIGEIGYWLAAEARGRGVASGAVRLIADWAYGGMALKRLEITTHLENKPSIRVAERNGFLREGVLRAYREHQGERVDLVMFARLIDDPVAPQPRPSV